MTEEYFEKMEALWLRQMEFELGAEVEPLTEEELIELFKAMGGDSDSNR